MNFRIRRSIALGAAWLCLALFGQAAWAATLSVDNVTDPNNVTFSMNDFEGGFFVNGVLIQIGLGSPAATTVAETANACIITYSGTWIDLGTSIPSTRTIYFVKPSDGSTVTDIFQINVVPGGTISGTWTTNACGPLGPVPGGGEIRLADGSPVDFSQPFLGASAVAGVLPADLQVTVVENSVDPVIAGSGLDNVNNTFTVTNLSQTNNATGVVAGFSANTTGGTIFSVPGCTYTPTAGVVTFPTWTIGSIPAGGSVSVTESCNITAASTAGANRELTLAVTAVSQEDPVPGNDSVTEDFTVARIADITVTKTQVTPDPIVAGSGASNLCYDVTITNAGPSDVTGLDLLDTWTAYPGITWASGGTPGGGGAQWTLDIAGGAPTVTDTICFTVDSTAAAGIFSNTFAATGSAGGEDLGNPLNHTETVVTTIVIQSYFDITKTWNGGAGEVDVTLTCSDGVVTPAVTTPTVGGQVLMTVTGFDNQSPQDCVVTETVPAGFFPTYIGDCDVDSITSGTTYDCEIQNGLTVARFNVTKDFSDDLVDDVLITLTCNTGLPLEQSLMISSDPLDPGVTFVVTDFIDGTMSCSVTEAGSPSGYTVDVSDCVWNDVNAIDGPFSCVVTNTAQDATFTVTKEWEIFNNGGDAVVESAEVGIQCDSLITDTNGYLYDCGEGYWCAYEYLGDGESLWVEVSTLTGDAYCSVYEYIGQSGVESDTEDCYSRYLSAGSSESCVIYNTVFFEGIPTLSQYGLAIMALLMLGMGFIGFRRFA